jgi:hypothetical protein
MGGGCTTTHVPAEQKFFGSFFQKRTAYFLNESIIDLPGLHLRQPCLLGFSHGDAFRLAYMGAAGTLWPNPRFCHSPAAIACAKFVHN